MISITETAAEKAKEILKAEGKDNWGLRIYSAQGGGCGPSYGMDIDETASSDDDVVEKNGLKVFVDKDTSQNLDGMEIDFVDEGDRKGFILTGGPSSSSCGSGCSSCG